MQMNSLQEFFNSYQVFRLEDLNEFIKSKEPNKAINIGTRNNLITYHTKQKRLLRIRKELYQTIPLGQTPEKYSVDPYLLASKLTDDAIISHHTALELHAKAHSVFNTFYYWTHNEIRHTFEYQDLIFKAVQQRKILIDKKQENFGVKLLYRKEQDLRVTSIERTLVDVLDRPKLAGEWEEIWRSLASIDYLDIDEIYRYCSLLENSSIIAKVGFYLEQHQDKLAVTNNELDKFAKLKPQNACYLQRGEIKESSKLIKRWNLIVPNEILERGWEEA